MRPAHFLSSFVLAACTASALPAWAQAPATLHLATDPAAAAVPLHHQPMSASGEVEAAQTDWRSANEAVADFPRGHVDILAWEVGQARAAGSPSAAQPTPSGMHQHSPAPRPGGHP